MERGDAILLVVACPEPECKNRQKQTAQFGRAELKRMLDAGEDVRVFGAVCGHMWGLSAVEKENTRKAIAAGAL